MGSLGAHAALPVALDDLVLEGAGREQGVVEVDAGAGGGDVNRELDRALGGRGHRGRRGGAAPPTVTAAVPPSMTAAAGPTG